MREWNKGKPPPNIFLQVRGSDYMGEFIAVMMWVPYSLKGPKRQHGKGRWMWCNEYGKMEFVGRKNMPEEWRILSEEALEKEAKRRRGR